MNESNPTSAATSSAAAFEAPAADARSAEAPCAPPCAAERFQEDPCEGEPSSAPAAAQRPWLTPSGWTCCVLASLVWLGLALAVLLTRATFGAIFADFETPTPAATRWILSLPAWAILTVTIGLCAALVVIQTAARPRWVGLACHLLALLVGFAAWLAYIGAMYLPLRGLVENLAR